MADQVRHFVHPGYVRSRTDEDIHFISFPMLCRLYKLNPMDPNVINAQMGLKRKGYRPLDSDRHYYPRYDGKYT